MHAVPSSTWCKGFRVQGFGFQVRILSAARVSRTDLQPFAQFEGPSAMAKTRCRLRYPPSACAIQEPIAPLSLLGMLALGILFCRLACLEELGIEVETGEQRELFLAEGWGSCNTRYTATFSVGI
jgi:hypothetical protein